MNKKELFDEIIKELEKAEDWEAENNNQQAMWAFQRAESIVRWHFSKKQECCTFQTDIRQADGSYKCLICGGIK